MIDYQQMQDMIVYLEIIAGACIEMLWIAKTFLIFYIVFKAWGLVRK